MEILYYSPVVERMKETICQQTGRTSPFASHFYEVKRELRLRRRLFLGSDVLLKDLVKVNGVIDDNSVEELSHYLAAMSIRFCGIPNFDKSRIFARFYAMSIHAFCEGASGDGCIDDILFSAECLALSRDSFLEYMKMLLPGNLIGELFDLVERYADFLSSPMFPEAVLGAICILLGVIEEPYDIPKQSVNISKEAIERARSRAKK